MSVLLQIIERTRDTHPKECIFRWSNDEILGRTLELAGPGACNEEIISACVTAFREAEIYCPHEGINRMPSI